MVKLFIYSIYFFRVAVNLITLSSAAGLWLKPQKFWYLIKKSYYPPDDLCSCVCPGSWWKESGFCWSRWRTLARRLGLEERRETCYSSVLQIIPLFKCLITTAADDTWIYFRRVVFHFYMYLLVLLVSIALYQIKQQNFLTTTLFKVKLY